VGEGGSEEEIKTDNLPRSAVIWFSYKFSDIPFTAVFLLNTLVKFCIRIPTFPDVGSFSNRWASASELMTPLESVASEDEPALPVQYDF